LDFYDPDYDLILLVGKGNIIAYRELVHKHLNKGLRIAERMLGNRSRQDAEDIMQEVCLKIWDGAYKWKPEAKFSTWLYRVIINACIDYNRKVASFSDIEIGEIIDPSPNADEVMIKNNIAIKVKVALGKLPDRQRAAIVLSYYEGVSNQESAHIIGVRLGAFQQLLFRAKQNLKNELKEYFVEYKNG